MTIPTFKKITINSQQKRMIYAQLDQHEFGAFPYIFNFHELVQSQIEAIKNIEDYLVDHSISLFPYPIYIIADVNNYHGHLNVVSDPKFIPKFYEQKERPLNSKEEQLYSKVLLKQKNLSNLQEIDFFPVITEYARTHKSISLLSSELEFLKSINGILGESDHE
jgi:hypothetical protein